MARESTARSARLDELSLLIESRLGGQVRRLQIERVSGRRVILHGRTDTYHAKQLVERTVLDLLDGPMEVEDEIDVCSAESREVSGVHYFTSRAAAQSA